MFSIKSLLDGWNKFFFSDESPATLGVYRILFGFLNVINAASLIPDATAWFGTAEGSTLPMYISKFLYNGFRVNLFNWLANNDTSMWFILIGYLIFSVMLTVGLKSRLSAIMTFILLISIQNRNFMILNSGDTVLKCLGFLMMFAPSGAALSIDSWLNFRKTGKRIEKVKITTIRLMQIQFSLVYLATFLFKSYGDMWVDGTATYYTARLISFQRVVIPHLFDYMWSVKMMTWSALIIEGALGTVIWIKELKYLVVLAGIALHIGIELTMSIGFFEWMMLFSFVLFVDGEHMEHYFVDKINTLTDKVKKISLLSEWRPISVARSLFFKL